MKGKLKVFIRTFGCQMNSYDTEVAEGILENAGYKVISEVGYPEDGTSEGSQSGDPSFVKSKMRTQDDDLSRCKASGCSSIRRPMDGGVRADIFLMNTCSVRGHAEERVIGRLGMLAKMKAENPDLIVGLMGCMVEEHREKLFKRFPHLDLMVGTRNIKELPRLIEQVRKKRAQIAEIKQDGISIEYTDQIKRQSRYHAWLPIMTGCDKKCTFCIVPITRGREVSMPAGAVVAEAQRLVGEGVKWVTLLGQNVNSYHGENQVEGGMTKVEASFPQLMDELCRIEGLECISFTTSHPQDATEELFDVIARNPKISRRFHLPLQSGSDKILKRMKRMHTYAEYKEKVDRLRALVPGISITTDIIAGFPGENDEDHDSTMKALEEIRFDDAFIYKYSMRPGTPASKLADDVPIKIKEKRNAELLKLQRKIRREVNEHYLGQIKEVFVEGVSPKDQSQLVGRTRSEKKVVFSGKKTLIGTFQTIRFESLSNETFIGRHMLIP